MNRETNSFLSAPVATLLGSIVVAIAILLHGGIIQIQGVTPKGATAPTPAAPAAPPAAAGAQKTEAEIITALKDQAQKLSLNTNEFNTCLDSGAKADLVKKDQDEGTAAGVNGTPNFFVNGRSVAGAVPYDQFKKIIEEELNGTAPSTEERKTVGVGDLPPQGNANAKVTIVEFSDYECPFCSSFFTQTEVQIKKDYIDTGKVKFYYRDFPLTQIHPGAQKGAEAARCAGDQDKYWQYHDALFINQSNIF
jgi:protein-disulfide isomerase